MGKDRWSHPNRGGNKRGGFNRGGFGRGRGYRGGRHGNRVNNDQWQKRERNETPGPRLTEEDIGVTEYMSDHEGFHGVIKLRFSDFQVSEINEQGEEAKLTDLSLPEAVTEEITEDEELILNKYNVEILPMNTWNQINTVMLGEDPNMTSVEIDVSSSTKEERTRIHEAVKKAFGDSIIGSTVNKDDVKLIKFEKYRKGARFDRRVKWPWGADYVHFVLHKENCDTMEAASRLVDRLNTYVKPLVLGYAGTKDRRAKTSQFFSLKRVEPKKIANACKLLNFIHTGNYTFKDYGLKLGMLKGNKFRIALRNVTASDGVVAEACARLSRGFINYYGLQRFGAQPSHPTHLVGKLMLQGNYKEAIDTILCPREGPLCAGLSARLSLGPSAGLHLLPHLGGLEAKLMAALAHDQNDLLGALFRIPRNTRLLYLHAYQSLQWNRAVSERVRRFGLQPAVGDLVALADDVAEEVDDAPEDQKEDGQDPKEDSADPEERTEPKRELIPVKVLTQEDLDSQTYTIFDVVMPLAGYLVQYPPNIKDYYEGLLKADGLTPELRHKNKNLSLSGAYRRMCMRPDDVQWSIVRYNDPMGDLIRSDIDIIRGNTKTCAVEDGKYKALLLTFTLPSSCYATQALRELLKTDTSAHTQAKHNTYHKRKASLSEESEQKRTKHDGESELEGNNEGESELAGNNEGESELAGNNEGESEIIRNNERESDCVGKESDC